MTELQKWFHQQQAERTVKALQKNNFAARFVPETAEALAEIFNMIPPGARVGWGGSVTLTEIGFLDEAKKRDLKLMNWAGLPPDEALEIRRQMLLCDVYLTSSNAVTEDGKLYNVDATGNRVGGMMFGPKKVIVVCGVNKIVKDIAAAQDRVREYVAPTNARRLGYKTPCAETGVCADCSSPQRICNIYAVLAKKPTRTDMTVLLVGESLGL